MAATLLLSTGLIDNRASVPGGSRPVESLVIRVENNEVVSASVEGQPIVLIEVFNESPAGDGFGTQCTYALNQVSLGDVNQPSSAFTLDNVFANLDGFGVRCTVTSSGPTLTSVPSVTVTGKNASGAIVGSYPLYSTSP